MFPITLIIPPHHCLDIMALLTPAQHFELVLITEIEEKCRAKKKERKKNNEPHKHNEKV